MRRARRGGEGQYLVNGATVRRTEVVELLADLGLGGSMHSVIGQGRVEQILASRPADRRALIEETAGLGRFKRRRHRAELKLGRVSAQVERARDREGEVRKRLRPLALQATAAARAEKLGREIDGIRARLAAAELDRLDGLLATVAERKLEAERERRGIDGRLAAVLAERRRAEEELGEAAGSHERATAALYRLRSARERVELRREQAVERTRSLRVEAEREPPATPRRGAYERVLATASAWSAARIARAEDGLGLLDRARVEGRDAVVALGEGELWFAVGNARAVERPPASGETFAFLGEASARLAAILDAAARSAGRFEASLQGRVDARGGRTGELGERLRGLGAQEAELRRAAGLAAERLTTVGIEEARLEREREGVLAALAPGRGGEPLPPDEAEHLRSELARLERRREGLGQVNPLAAEEHARESERLAELVRQREDLERSLAELERLGAHLAETIERRFAETYAAVERHFAAVAATLFPGGKGRLVATPPGDDGEEPGIEIELQPAGKRIGKLSLLSGGEKALGAISFLFALFLARPCPFYLLDEVEAALDDANIGRFVELLRRFSAQAQFIVVTHQKRTMEAADILYGVTMGADGVSQVVSRRFPRLPRALTA